MSRFATLKVIDAHHHLWDLKKVHYPWLMAKGVKRFFGDPAPIQKDYLVEDLRSDAGEIILAGSVHIQVGANNSFEETTFVESQSKNGLPQAHVADTNLQAGNISHVLNSLSDFPLVRGVRQIVGRHPVEDAKNGSDALIDDPNWQKGLKILSNKGLSFDLQMIAPQYERMVNILSTLPNLRVAICHFASPWDQDVKSLQHWKDNMARLSELPNVYMKFSGFSMFKPNWNLDDIEPYILASLDLFGEDRCMVGSNYPVDGLHRPYEDIFCAVYDLTKGEAFQQKLFFDNANRFSKLGL